MAGRLLRGGMSAFRLPRPLPSSLSRALQVSRLPGQLRGIHATNPPAAERKVHFDQIDSFFEELGIGKELTQEVGGIRVRQHVNPLKKDLQVPAPPLSWVEAYSEPRRPLVLDIGTGYGRFLLALSRALPGHNLLGLEIRDQVVERAQRWSEVLGLSGQVRFVRANATVSLRSMLASYPAHLDLVTIQFPDPHFKRKHRKRRVVQAQLVAALAHLMRPGGRVLLQSDVEEVAASMRNEFEEHGKGAFALSPLHAPGAVFHSPTPQQQQQQQQQQQHASGTAAKSSSASHSSSELPAPARREPYGGSSSEEGAFFRGVGSGYSSGDESGQEASSSSGLSVWRTAGEPGGEQQGGQQQHEEHQEGELQVGGSGDVANGSPPAGCLEGQDVAAAAERRTRKEWAWAAGGWLLENPLGIPTEREVYVTEQGLPVYRVLLVRT